MKCLSVMQLAWIQFLVFNMFCHGSAKGGDCKPNRPSFLWFGKSMPKTYTFGCIVFFYGTVIFGIFRVSVLGVEKESYQYVFLFRVR